MNFSDTPVFSSGIALPLYLLIDVSSSMNGSKIDSLNNAIRVMVEDMSVQRFNETDVQLCVITFGDKAKLHLAPTSVYNIKWSPVFADGVTALGAAIKMLKKMIEDKVITPQKSYRPTIVVVTDGTPTDSYEAALEDFLRNGRSSKTDRLALGIGLHADEAILNKWVDSTGHSVFKARNVLQVQEFFKRLTKSIVLRANSANPNVIPDDALSTPDDQNDFE